jgi:hypothetical protein
MPGSLPDHRCRVLPARSKPTIKPGSGCLYRLPAPTLTSTARGDTALRNATDVYRLP